jgi:hypothetical protein
VKSLDAEQQRSVLDGALQLFVKRTVAPVISKLPSCNLIVSTWPETLIADIWTSNATSAVTAKWTDAIQRRNRRQSKAISRDLGPEALIAPGHCVLRRHNACHPLNEVQIQAWFHP